MGVEKLGSLDAMQCGAEWDPIWVGSLFVSNLFPARIKIETSLKRRRWKSGKIKIFFVQSVFLCSGFNAEGEMQPQSWRWCWGRTQANGENHNQVKFLETKLICDVRKECTLCTAQKVWPFVIQGVIPPTRLKHWKLHTEYKRQMYVSRPWMFYRIRSC